MRRARAQEEEAEGLWSRLRRAAVRRQNLPLALLALSLIAGAAIAVLTGERRHIGTPT